MHTPILNGFGTQESDLFSMLFELLCRNGGIIKVPDGVKYTQDDTIAVISYAATSTANSVEAAVKEIMISAVIAIGMVIGIGIRKIINK